jgi:hypothetical protein
VVDLRLRSAEARDAYIEGVRAGLEYAAYSLEQKNDETKLKCMIDLFRRMQRTIHLVVSPPHA